ncbi:MAG: hypothetical protein ABSD67_05335 [Terracidiphilus sp.]|jgi:hypothetical protein
MKVKQEQKAKSPRSPQARALWVGVVAGVAAIVLVPLVGEGLQVRDPGFRYPPSVTRIPDANTQADINGQDSKDKDFEAANAERKKQIANDSAKLLKLATDLKSEVDKTNKDTLSLNVIRKADEIEKLAHDVKEKMKLTVGPG